MGPDGTSYVDIAMETAKNGPSTLVNGFWSPAYPAVLAVAFYLFRPSPLNQFPLVHLVNYLIFVLTLWSFTFFLKSWLAVRRTAGMAEEEPHIIPFSFSLFLWFTMNLITPGEVSPDMGVAAIIFLAAGVCFRLSLPGSNWTRFLLLGGILGAGFYAKAVIVPVGCFLLALLFLRPPSRPGSRLGVILAGVVFLIISAPLMGLISQHVGHLSFGETGRLNYLWHSAGLRPLHEGWTGGPDGRHGIPEHPPRILVANPKTLEFAGPVKGTYPLWYESSYWYAGAKGSLDIKEQIVALKITLSGYWVICQEMSALFAGALVLGLLGLRRNVFPARDRNYVWFLIWPTCVCLMYSIVWFEPRYVSAFLLLFWLAAYTWLWSGVTFAVRSALLLTVVGALYIPMAGHLATATARSVHGILSFEPPDYAIAGDALQAAGLHRGDRLASVGAAFDAYYAQYAGMRFVAEVVDVQAFAHINPAEFAKLKDRLAEIGVKALVSFDKPITSGADGWQGIILPESQPFRFVLLNPPGQNGP